MPFTAPLAPAETLAVVGDIHGCDRLLANMLEEIDALAPDRLVFVGDFIDRGDDSAAVLARLQALGDDLGPRVVFLRGNHEEMLLRFLDDPAAQARRWLPHGGLQTLASFGVGGVSQNLDGAKAVQARDALARAIGPDRLAWLRALPTRFVSGNVAVVHAGADPALPIAAQPDNVLVWGHPDFTTTPRNDGIWVVHGHIIQPGIAPVEGRIGVDTGAYATGRLSGALIEPGRFTPVTAKY